MRKSIIMCMRVILLEMLNSLPVLYNDRHVFVGLDAIKGHGALLYRSRLINFA